jgi:hypothetical protein
MISGVIELEHTIFCVRPVSFPKLMIPAIPKKPIKQSDAMNAQIQLAKAHFVKVSGMSISLIIVSPEFPEFRIPKN